LTSDIWSGKAKEDYISVVAHFVNSDWCLEKRLLGVRPIEVAHTCLNIAERVEMVANDYIITDKIFVIMLDNASSNKTAIDVLKPVFAGPDLGLISTFLCGGNATIKPILFFLY
jgi:mannose/fructose/N-acetylgalactosamine-specific phosphotransferase system component IIB